MKLPSHSTQQSRLADLNGYGNRLGEMKMTAEVEYIPKINVAFFLCMGRK
jgi:hypothetical protein